MKGFRISFAVAELLSYKGEIDTDSMGALKLVINNNEESFVFSCDSDSESLAINKGDFLIKSALETESLGLKWIQEEFVSKEYLDNLSNVRSTNIEWLVNDHGIVQSGCKIEFDSDQFLYIWTMGSDNLFYGFNKYPQYHSTTELKTIGSTVVFG